MGMEGVPKQETNQEKPKAVSPEDIGFRAVEGRDFISAKPEASSKIEAMGIDNTEERRGRFQNLLENVSRYASNSEILDALKKASETIQAEGTFEADTEDIAVTLDFVKSVLAANSDPSVLKLVLEKGQRESIQESVSRAGKFLSSPDLGLSEEAQQSAWSAIKLAQELYAQGHEGRGYVSTEQKKEFEEAKERSKNLNIS